MERTFNSLEDVSNYAHSLIRDKSEKDIKKLNSLEILEWFIASQRFVAEKAVDIIRHAGLKVENRGLTIKVACFFFDNFYGAYYNRQYSNIVIGTKCIFGDSYNQLIGVIIHELTHMEIMGHNDNFWQRYLELLTIEGFAEPGLSVDEAFIKDTITIYRHASERLPLMRGCLLREISAGNNDCERYMNFDRKYHIFRRNPIFCRDNWDNIRRLNDLDFKDDVVRLCREYEVDYNTIYRRSHHDENLPDFIGIDKQWNPYSNAYH